MDIDRERKEGYIYIYIVEEGLDGHGLLYLSFRCYAIPRVV